MFTLYVVGSLIGFYTFLAMFGDNLFKEMKE